MLPLFLLLFEYITVRLQLQSDTTSENSSHVTSYQADFIYASDLEVRDHNFFKCRSLTYHIIFAITAIHSF